MLMNGKNKKIGNSGLPNMAETIKGWFQNIEIGYLSVSNVDFEKVETISTIKTQGFLQPASWKVLQMLTEGQRAWSVFELYVLPDLDVSLSDYVFYRGKKYKVIKKEDYLDYGYLRYFLTEANADE